MRFFSCFYLFIVTFTISKYHYYYQCLSRSINNIYYFVKFIFYCEIKFTIQNNKLSIKIEIKATNYMCSTIAFASCKFLAYIMSRIYPLKNVHHVLNIYKSSKTNTLRSMIFFVTKIKNFLFELVIK